MKTTQVPVEIDLDDIKVVKNENHEKKISLDDKIMMEMKYPSLDQFIKNNFDFSQKNAMDQSFELIDLVLSLSTVKMKCGQLETSPRKEVTEFLESMNSSQFKGIEEFFNTMPKLSHTIKVKTPIQKLRVKLFLRDWHLFSRRHGSYESL